MQIWAVSLTIRSCHAKMNVFNFGRWHTRTCYGPLIRLEHNKSWMNVWMSWHKIDESSNDSGEFFSHSWYEHVSEIATFSNSLKLAFKSFRDHFSPPILLNCSSASCGWGFSLNTLCLPNYNNDNLRTCQAGIEFISYKKQTERQRSEGKAGKKRLMVSPPTTWQLSRKTICYSPVKESVEARKTKHISLRANSLK